MTPRAERWARTQRARDALLLSAKIDDQAADRYDELAALPGREPELAADYRERAIECRRVAAASRAEASEVVAYRRRR